MVKAALGLGNPGPEYEDTRHNFGFKVVEEVARRLRARWSTQPWGQVGVGQMGEVRLVVAKPSTFMNLSGAAAQSILSWYSLRPEDLLVIHDDADIAFGKIKLSFGGGDGGHKGIRSVVQHVGTKDFPRLRMGIGRPLDSGTSMTEYVLRPFSKEETKELDTLLDKAFEAVATWATQGLGKAQTVVNARPRRAKRSDGVSPYPSSTLGSDGRKEEIRDGSTTAEEVRDGDSHQDGRRPGSPAEVPSKGDGTDGEGGRGPG